MTIVALSSSSLTMRCCASGIHKRGLATLSKSLSKTLSKTPPIFVYGSLLSGFPQHALLISSSLEKAPVPARASGFALAHFKEGGYPGMFPEPPLSTRWRHKAIVEGELMYLKVEEEAEVLARLDKYEEFFGPHDERNQYERVSILAHTSSEEHPTMVVAQAYLCVAPDAMKKLGGTIITDGNWRRMMSAQQNDAGTPLI